MASKEEKDKAREERLLLRNKNKEEEEGAKLIKEGTKRIQEGRQQILKDRENRKGEMRKMVHSQLDILAGIGTTDSAKSQIETSEPDYMEAESGERRTKQSEFVRSFSLGESKLSAGTVSEPDLMKDKVSQSMGNFPREMDLGVKLKDGKVSHSMGDNPRELESGVTFEDGKQNPLNTREIALTKETGIVSRLTRDAPKEPDKSKDILASVDAKIAELHEWLAKNPMKKSEVISGKTDSVPDMQLMGSKGTIVKEHSVHSVKSDNDQAVKTSLQIDTPEKKEAREYETTENISPVKGTAQRGTIEDTGKNIRADRSLDKECLSPVSITGTDDLSKADLKDAPWRKGTERDLDRRAKVIAQALSSPKYVCELADFEEDSKEEFDYDQFIRELDGQGFGNVASTVKKSPKEHEKAQQDVNSKESNEKKDSDKGEKYHKATVELPNVHNYSIQQEQKQSYALDTRENELARQELDLKWRQENEKRLNKMREDSEWSMLVKMKEERRKREAVIKAREDELEIRKLELERIETDQKAERQSGKFLPTTIMAMREEENLKASLKARENEISKQEDELRVRRERKNREEKLRREFELAELEKLKDERRRMEESLYARLSELKEKQTVLEHEQKRQPESLHASILVSMKKEEQLIDAMKSREEEITQQEIALIRRQKDQEKSLAIQQHIDNENLSALREERKRRETFLSLREEEIKNKKAELDKFDTERKARSEKERLGLLAFLEEQQNRNKLLDEFENALRKKESHLGKIAYAGDSGNSVECRLLQEARNRKESDLREREEKLKIKQAELDNYEKSILLQEEEQKRKERALHSEEILAQREKEFERRMLEMKLREEQLLKREQSLKERESSLLLSKNSFQRSYEGLKDIETPVKVQDKENEVLAELKSVAMKGNSTIGRKETSGSCSCSTYN